MLILFKKFFKRRREDEPVDYWLSMTDLMSALILIVLLIFALVLLYLVKYHDVEYEDLVAGDTYAYDYIGDYEDEPDDYDGDARVEEDGLHEPVDTAGGGGGGGGGGTEHEHDHEYDYEYPGLIEDTGKTAVHVTVIDAETEKAIRKSGTAFRLFRSGGNLQVLYSYYPRKTGHYQYSTTDEGNFYFPEKIPDGSYYLTGLTAPEGYDLSDDIEFLADEARDWDEALEVTVPLFPSRNVIRVTVTDRETGERVSGAEFDIIADEDIITFDGTLRFSEGEVAGHIVCTDGFGESAELYLGRYRLAETKIPEYYAGIGAVPAVEVENKDLSDGSAVTLETEKTCVTYCLRDELEPDGTIAGAAFEICKDGSPVQAAVTDEDGRIILTGLEKGAEYTVRQTGGAGGYRPVDEEAAFRVSEDGTVEGSARADYDIYNRIIRTKIEVRDRLFGNEVADVSAALYTEDGTLVHRWDSTGLSEAVDGIEPGLYRIVLKGDAENASEITVEDTAAEQTFTVRIRTGTDIAAAGLLAAIPVSAAAVLVRKRKKNGGADHE